MIARALYVSLWATSLVVYGCARTMPVLPLRSPGSLPQVSIEPDRPFEVLDHLVRYDIRPNRGETWIRHRFLVMVHSAAGLRVGDFVFRAWPGARIVGFSAQSRAPSGEIQTAALSDLDVVDAVLPLGEDVAKVERHVGALARLEPGTILEVSYVLLVAYPMLSGTYLMDGFRPARSITLELAAPSFVELKTEAMHGVRALSSSDGVKRFQLVDIPREFEPVPLAPWLGRRQPRVRWRFTSARHAWMRRNFNQTWRDALAQYIGGLDRLKRAPPEMGPLPSLPRHPPAAVIRAVRWLREKIRVQSGDRLAGLSRDDESLVRRAIVTPDDFTRLLWMVLARRGVALPLALVPGYTQPDAAPEAPTPTVGSYDLLLVINEKEGLYFDPYCRGCRIGELRPEHRDRSGVLLEVNKNQARPHRTPQLRSRRPERSADTTIDLSAPGGHTHDFALHLAGAAAGELRSWVQNHRWSPGELKRALAREYFPHARGGQLELGPTASASVALSLRGAGTTLPVLRRSKAHLIVSLGRAFPQPWLQNWPRERALPVFLGRKTGFTHRLRVLGATVTSTGGDQLSSVAGRYTWALIPLEVGGFQLEERLELAQDTLPPNRYPEVRDFFRAVDRARRRALFLPRTRPEPTAPGDRPRLAPLEGRPP